MSQVELYKATVNGSAAKELLSKNTLRHKDRTFLCKDFTKNVIWVLHGDNVNDEVNRLLSYAIEMVNDAKFTVIDIRGDNREELKTYILGVNSGNKKNEQYVNDILATQESEKRVVAEKQEVKESVMHPVEKSSQQLMEKKKTTKKSPQQLKKEAQATKKSEPKRRSVATPSIPTPTVITRTNTPDPFVLAGDRGTGPMIDEFQIAYYEQTHGQNYVLVEELSEKLNSEQFTMLQEHVKLLNKVLIGKISKIKAKQLLLDSIDDLLKL